MDSLTLADHAAIIRDRIGAGEPTARLLVQATNDVIDADLSELPMLIAAAPPPTGHAGIDAYLAALVEHVLGDRAPQWTHEPARFTAEAWVITPYPDDLILEQLIRDRTPPAFARHGVYIDASDLTSA